MLLWEKIRPNFWHQDAWEGPHRSLFNYRRIWRLAVGLLAAVALIPLIVLSVIDFKVTRQAMLSETLLVAERVTSNTRRTLIFFFSERLAALDLAARENSYSQLADPDRLPEVLKNLAQSFGGIVDLGVIRSDGLQIAYTGPYALQNRNYADQEWFMRTMERGSYISGVFMGFRNVPHVIIAVKAERSDGSYYVLRATLDSQRINEMLSDLDLSGGSDAFLVDKEGRLQTPSRFHGQLFDRIELPIPEYDERTQVCDCDELGNGGLILSSAYINDSPLVLMVVKPKAELMKPWYAVRFSLIGFLVVNICIILLVVVGVATYLINKIHIADQTRAQALHQMEHSCRMASIGRLAAGVAHEINNPLAIINEKAGLMKDLLAYAQQEPDLPRLIGLLDSVIGSVERCGAITRRLLGFARHLEVSVEAVEVKTVIEEVLSFLTREAEYRNIAIEIQGPDEPLSIVSDRGKLQQIFLNLINNAFQAMSDGGNLRINLMPTGNGISVRVADDGCGIPADDVQRIFEPFFSTKRKKGGTGLGLSITYGLVQELGGDLEVKSDLGKGTTFTVKLPLEMKRKSA